MTHQPDQQINMILRFIEALHADPGAAPPPGLDAADIALARDLARTMPRSTLGSVQRQRIWQRALAEAVRQRLAQSESHQPYHSQSNGHHARQETQSMISQPTMAQPIPRQRTRQHTRSQQPRARSIWITGLVAAISALVIGGLLLTGLGDSQPPATSPNMGAGIGVTDNTSQQQLTDPSATPETPVLEAVRDLPVQAGPGAEYSVLMTLEAGGKLDITGISEDGAWYQVLVPGGSFGWITVSAALVNIYGDLVDLPVVVVPTPTLVPTATLTPVLPSPTHTATPTATHDLQTTVWQDLTATAVNDYFGTMAVATPTPVQFQPSGGPTVMPFTATPVHLSATLAPEDFTGIYQHMWREYSKYAENIEPMWSSNGQYLFVANEDNVDIFEMGVSDVRVAGGHNGNVTTMALHPFGTILATGTENGEVRLYVLPDAEDFVALDGVCETECSITGVEFNPTGTYLLVTSESESGQYVHVYALPETLYR